MCQPTMPALYRTLALLDIMPNTDYYRWRVPVRCQAISPALSRQKALFNRHYKGTITGIVNTSKYLVRDTVRYRCEVSKNYTTLYVQVSFEGSGWCVLLRMSTDCERVLEHMGFAFVGQRGCACCGGDCAFGTFLYRNHRLLN